MFKENIFYWFKLKSGDKEVNMKAKVIEETPYLLHVEDERGNKSLIATARILNVNEDRK